MPILRGVLCVMAGAVALGIGPAAHADEEAPVGAVLVSEAVHRAVEYVGVIQVEEAVVALQEQVGEFLASIPPPPPPVPVRPVTVASSAPAGGGACGGATNGADQFIQRESGGNPQVFNPSGAYGCYQIMPGTWASSCPDLGSYGNASPGVQAQCASRLPLSAWGG